MASFKTLQIKHIRRETSKAVSLCFDVPKPLEAQYRFEAGQYLTLKAVIDGEEVRRDYSICSSPDSGELTVTVKEIPNGLFSSYANRSLAVGDAVEVAPPKGRFVLNKTHPPETIVGFAAGSGITPIMSHLKTTLETNTFQKFVLIYGNKSPKETIFYDEILALKKQYNSRFEVQFLFSQSHEDTALFGRIDRGNTTYILKQNTALLRSSTFYLCGPEGMIQTVQEVLLENGVSRENILFELFSSKQITSEPISSIKQCKISVTLLVDDDTESFEMESDKTILEAALNQNIDVPYSCQGGVCSSCICRITEGSAEMRQNSVLTDSEVAEGLILSCQAVPTSSKIHVDFDDI